MGIALIVLYKLTWSAVVSYCQAYFISSPLHSVFPKTMSQEQEEGISSFTPTTIAGLLAFLTFCVTTLIRRPLSATLCHRFLWLCADYFQNP